MWENVSYRRLIMWSCRISFVVSSAMSFFAFVLFRSVVALRSEALAYYDCHWWKSRHNLLATAVRLLLCQSVIDGDMV